MAHNRRVTHCVTGRRSLSASVFPGMRYIHHAASCNAALDDDDDDDDIWF